MTQVRFTLREGNIEEKNGEEKEFYFFKLGDKTAMMVQVRERIAGVPISCGYRWKIPQ